MKQKQPKHDVNKGSFQIPSNATRFKLIEAGASDEHSGNTGQLYFNKGRVKSYTEDYVSMELTQVSPDIAAKIIQLLK